MLIGRRRPRTGNAAPISRALSRRPLDSFRSCQGIGCRPPYAGSAGDTSRASRRRTRPVSRDAAATRTRRAAGCSRARRRPASSPARRRGDTTTRLVRHGGERHPRRQSTSIAFSCSPLRRRRERTSMTGIPWLAATHPVIIAVRPISVPVHVESVARGLARLSGKRVAGNPPPDTDIVGKRGRRPRRADAPPDQRDRDRETS